jgi:hypothetical protein
MNPDTGDDAEDWFAKFEREAREAAQQRAAEEDAAAPPAPSVPPAAAPPPLVPPPPAAAPPAGPPPQLNNPFNPPAQPPASPPVWEQPPTEAMPTTYGPGTTYGPPLVQPPAQPPAQPPVQPPSYDPGPTQAMPSFPEEPTQALVPAPLRPPGSPEPGSALDALFGDDAFREYEDGLGPDPTNSPFANRSKDLVYVPGGDGPPPPRGFGTPQKILAGVGGGLLAVIALIALFLLGTRLPDLLGPAPAVATPTPTPTPTREPLAAGPVAPGTYDWDELLGGECLEPYDVAAGAWAEEYTVVDCATPHTAQMVYRAWFPPEPVPTPDPDDPDAEPVDPNAEPVWAEYPGPEALQAQISLLCAASGAIDYAAAREYTDAQVQGSYPMTAEQWETDPSYYCFVSRSSGAPLTKSLAVPR